MVAQQRRNHRSDQAEEHLDSSDGREGRIFRMAAIALGVKKSVLFGLLIIFEKNQRPITFEECYP